MFQVPFSEQIRIEADIPTLVAGNIFDWDQVNTIVGAGRSDLVALAREILYNPNWPMDAARKLGVERDFGSVPPQQAYWLEKRATSITDMMPSTYQVGIEGKG